MSITEEKDNRPMTTQMQSASDLCAAVAYIRTSSATNCGSPEKDSMTRQSLAICAYAERKGLPLIASFYDGAVSGADQLDARPGFSALLCFCRESGCRQIIVESASRFARDLIVQETGVAMLAREGIAIIAADDESAFAGDTPTAIMVRQILGAVAQFEKAGIVSKLKGARERRSASLGVECRGRGRVYAAGKPELLSLAKSLAPHCSLRVIAERLALQGHRTATGRAFSPQQVKRLIAA